MSKTALITGLTGQDGSYLAELLLKNGYNVHGIVRRLSTPNLDRISHILNKITIHDGDLLDSGSLVKIVDKVKPTEVYNLAAQSFVGASWSQPVLTSEITAIGALKLLDAVKTVDKSIKFYQASSSEMFGKVVETPQRESTPFYPRSPYGVSKQYAHWMTINYRESYGMFAVSGILFNHESERRGIEFVTRKISNAVARIMLGKQRRLVLGNLDAKRDWGHAADYVRAMWLMLQNQEPRDYVIATGQVHSVREFVDEAFSHVGLDWEKYVDIDEQFMRPAEVDLLCGDSTKARTELGWSPEIDFRRLVKSMVDYDLTYESKV